MSQHPINVAIAGVGNCASALVQALHFYGQPQLDTFPDGLILDRIDAYSVADIRVVAAFDVHAGKVGTDLGHAIFEAPNNTYRFATPPPSGVIVQRGPTLDGIGQHLQEVIPESPLPPVDVVQVLRDSEAQVLVNFLPVGSERATEYYLEQALAARCVVINCIPFFAASDPVWAERFRQAGVPIIGDDIKSQLGATILHRTLVHLMRARGIRLDHTYQLNFGGNADFQNMLERARLASKKVSKTRAVTSLLETPLPTEDVHVGPSDFVPWLQDRKFAHIRLEGSGVGGAPMSIEVKLEVWDSPNSAGVVLDAIRCARVALDRGEAGPIEAVSGYYMKSPPVQREDGAARAVLDAYLAGQDG